MQLDKLIKLVVFSHQIGNHGAHGANLLIKLYETSQKGQEINMYK